MTATGGRVAITAAPGGHSGYAFSIGYYLHKEYGVEPVFITARRAEWVRRKLSSIGIVVEVTMPRMPGEPLYRTIGRWAKAFAESIRVTGGVKVLVSCGSNLSVPPALVARLRGARLVNVESIVRFSSPGKTPRLLKPISHATIVHWPEQEKLHPGAIVAGPIYEPPRYNPRDDGFILITAGTTGHRELFDAAVRSGLRPLVIQTGRLDPSRYRRSGVEAFSFDPELDKWISRARVVVTHFPGMTSATAALAYNKPVVLAPARHLTMSASVEDCIPYARRIGAVCMDEVSPSSLERAVEEALRLERPHYDNGARLVAKLIYRLLG